MGGVGAKVSQLSSNLPFLSKKKEPQKEEFQIITRAEWRARVPRWREDLVYPALSAACVYSGTKHCTDRLDCVRAVQEIQNSHMDKDGLPDIEYSFLVGGDGSVFEGRGWHTMSNRNVTINCVDPERPPPPHVRRDATEEEKMSPARRIVIAYIGDPEAQHHHNEKALEWLRRLFMGKWTPLTEYICEKSATVLYFLLHKHKVSLATEVMTKAANKLVQFGINSYYLNVGKLMSDDDFSYLDEAIKELEEIEANGDYSDDGDDLI